MGSSNQPLKIDKNVPLPKAKSGGRANTKHFYDALDIMDVGDSIEFSIDKMDSDNQPISVQGRRFAAAARGRGFKMNRRLSQDRNTVRYWRVK